MATIVQTNGTLVDFGINAIVDQQQIPKVPKRSDTECRKPKEKDNGINGTRKASKGKDKEHRQSCNNSEVTHDEHNKSMAIPSSPTNNNSIVNIQQEVNPRNYEHLLQLADLIRKMANLGKQQPRIGIICGSGLGALADQMREPRILPFSEVPGFPKPKVTGHKGNLVFGHISGQLCVCLQGRFHPYEHQMDMALCTMPVRLMSMLGVRTLIVSNAAGGINNDFLPGDLMIIKDHVFLPGLTGHSPLLGLHDARFGTPFVSLHNAYDRDLRKKARTIAHKLKLPLREGVYVMNGGPQYETATECSLIARLGGDAVGMSTCHEVTVARQCGMRVFGFSLITNCSSLDADNPVPVSHEEVLMAAAKASPLASRWVAELIADLVLDQSGQ